MRASRSAGLVLHRRSHDILEILLVHPGGPFWAKKETAAWSIPKGLIAPGEDALVAAQREFEEETGFRPEGPFFALGEFKQPGGKTISAWAVAGDCDPAQLRSNTFTMEWPPRSGRIQAFPEADRAAWFDAQEAQEKLHKGQRPILAALLRSV